MTFRLDPVLLSGLQFFGFTTASVTHELKNALAIIKENAGLLDDYTQCMARGQPIDGARVRTVISRIEEQTRRADGIIRNLNSFAHSVDELEKSVDLNAVVELLVALAHRPAAMQRVNLVRRPAAGPVMLSTLPFLLLSGLGRFLNMVLPAAGPGQELIISVAKSPGGGGIVTFAPLPGLAQLPAERFGREEESPLRQLQAAYHLDPAAGHITITLGDAGQAALEHAKENANG